MKNMGTVYCKSPSNIALVKYWGKLPIQIPANPSISFSLKNCYTETSVELIEKTNDDSSFEFFFHNEPKPDFNSKISTFLERIKAFIPNCVEYKMIINSSNSFPHSSGIASSAASMSALAGCLGEWERALTNSDKDDKYYDRISEMARLGSGSAARSIFGGFALWGKHLGYDATNPSQVSSDSYAVPMDNIHPIFQTLQDTILLVDKGVKKVSSTVGHELMNDHPFARQRFKQANENIVKLQKILVQGDFKNFASLVESEALTLHAMMLTSDPSYILFRPNTIAIIEKVRQVRENDKLDICFTLDAGANVHLIYPKALINNVLTFIEQELVGFCENGSYICDEVGDGQEINSEINA